MSLLRTYRQKAQRLQADIAKLLKSRSDATKKRATLARKVFELERGARSSKSVATRNSKMRQMESKQKELQRQDDKVSGIEQKISQKQKDLGRNAELLSREEEKELKKRIKEEAQVAKRQEERLRKMGDKLVEHDAIHSQTLSAIEKIQELPEKIVILFIAANPVDQKQLRLDEEIRAIEQMILKSAHRDSIKLESKWAVRTEDLLQGINQYEPHIIHFSGHGSQEEIVFLDNSGHTKCISKDAIVQVMAAISSKIQLVFFNTCFSAEQAEAVTKHVDVAIGMNTAIGDNAARLFASQFYSAIGFGKSVGESFAQARAGLMLEGVSEENTPELFVRDGLDAHKLIIVRPEEITEE